MKITFDVKNQILSRTDRQSIISNSMDYLEAEVTFSEDWNGLEKNMSFVSGDTVYTFVLNQDGDVWKIAKNQHLNLGNGTWKASVIGVSGDVRIVTNAANVAIRASGYPGAHGPIPDVYEELLVIIQSLHTEAASSAVIRSAVEQYIIDNYDALVKEVVVIDDVRAALDDMADDGSLSALLDPLVAAKMPDEVTEQLPGVVADQIDAVVGDQIDASVASQISTPVNQAVNTYCAENFSEWQGGLDSTLTDSSMAAPADKVGDLKSALNEIAPNNFVNRLKDDIIINILDLSTMVSNYAVNKDTGAITADDTSRMFTIPIMGGKTYRFYKIASGEYGGELSALNVKYAFYGNSLALSYGESSSARTADVGADTLYASMAKSPYNTYAPYIMCVCLTDNADFDVDDGYFEYGNSYLKPNIIRELPSDIDRLKSVSEDFNVLYVTTDASQSRNGYTVSRVNSNRVHFVYDGETTKYAWYADILNGNDEQYNTLSGTPKKQFTAGTYTIVSSSILPAGIRVRYTVSDVTNCQNALLWGYKKATITVNSDFALLLNVTADFTDETGIDIDFAVYKGEVDFDTVYASQYTGIDYKSRAKLLNSVLKSDIVDNLNSSDATKVLSAKQGKTLKDMISTYDKLPSYVLTEVNRVSSEVQALMEPDSIVFAMYTDLHYSTVPTTDNDMHDLTCKAMRKLADCTPIDFSLDGGDLYNGNTFDNDREIINRAKAFTSGQRCPYLVGAGDHDKSQTSEEKITWDNVCAWTMPYLPHSIVRPSDSYLAKLLYYYYDVPNKTSSGVTTRVIVLGTSVWTQVKPIFKWLKTEVFTADVKDCYQFIILPHIPIDIDNMVGYVRNGKTPTRLSWNYAKLLDAINGATQFVYDYGTTQTVYIDSNGRVTSDTTATAYTMTDMTDEPNTNSNPEEYGTIDFTGWTSKVRLVASGHNHCDRFGFRSGGVLKSYLIGYTSQANKVRPDSVKSDAWFTARFGDEREDFTQEASGDGIIWWSDTKDTDRVTGTASEYLFDVYIVNSNNIKRVRFGCGRSMSSD